MPWVLLGMLLGGAWALLSLAVPSLAVPVDALTAAMAHTGAAAAEAGVRAVGLGVDSPLAHAVGALAAVLVPGAVCFVTAEAAVTSRAARNAAALVLTAGAAMSFLWVPGPQALALLVAALVLDALLAVGHVLLLRVPVAVVVSVVTVRMLLDINAGGGVLGPSVQALAAFGGDPALWKLALATAALAPGLAAVNMLVRRG